MPLGETVCVGGRQGGGGAVGVFLPQAPVNGDLACGNDLETAVMVNLFADAPATSDFIPRGHSKDRRGWWGSGLKGQPIGSTLWQLDRAKITSGTGILLQARRVTT